MRLLTGAELGCLQLLEVELLALLDELLALVLQALSFPLHGRLELFKVPQLDFELLHLCLHKQRHEALDLPLLDGRQVLGLHGGSSQSSRSSGLEVALVEDLPRLNATLLLLARALAGLLFGLLLGIRSLLQGVLLLGCFGIRFFRFMSFRFDLRRCFLV